MDTENAGGKKAKGFQTIAKDFFFIIFLFVSLLANGEQLRSYLEDRQIFIARKEEYAKELDALSRRDVYAWDGEARAVQKTATEFSEIYYASKTNVTGSELIQSMKPLVTSELLARLASSAAADGLLTKPRLIVSFLFIRDLSFAAEPSEDREGSCDVVFMLQWPENSSSANLPLITSLQLVKRGGRWLIDGLEEEHVMRMADPAFADGSIY